MNIGFVALSALRPRWVVGGVVVAAVLIWSASLYSITRQVGEPFPGFLYTPDRIVSSFTPQDFTGWQAGLRPWDRIVAVNGQHWREMRHLVREAGVGTPLVYTVERGDQRLQIAVPTMEFTFDILWRFIPGGLLFAILSLAVGIFVYVHNPGGRLNRYLLLYLLLWAGIIAAVWETFLSQQKWTAYLIHPWTAITTVAGWIFFWSFPADRARKGVPGSLAPDSGFCGPGGRVYGLFPGAPSPGLTPGQPLTVAAVPLVWHLGSLSCPCDRLTYQQDRPPAPDCPAKGNLTIDPATSPGAPGGHQPEPGRLDRIS